MNKHFQAPIIKADRIEDVIELLHISDRGDSIQLSKGLLKLTKSELANLYHHLRKLKV